MQDTDLSTQLSDATSAVVDKVTGWLQGFIELLPNLLVATVIVVAFVFLARFVRRMLERVLQRVSTNAPVRSLLSTTAYVGVLVIGVFIALGVLNLDKTVTSLLAGVGILGLALGFAFQDIAANFVSGVFLAVRHPFEAGDIIETNGITGRVQQVNLRTTLIRQFDGKLVHVPNKEVFGNPITNIYELGERRVDLAVGVSYGDDLEKAKRVAIEAIEGIEHRNTDRPVEVFFNEFGGSSINFELRFWVPYHGQHTDYLEARSQAVIRVKQAFDANDISIPFPIRTLDLGDNLAPFKEVFAGRANLNDE